MMDQIPWVSILEAAGKAGLSLSSSVKSSVGFLWPLAVRQSTVYAIADCVWGALLGAIGVFLLVFGMRVACRESDTWGNDDGCYSILTVVLGVIVLLVALVCLCCGGLRFANPQWYAIRDLINAIRP
jgi:hypothetical protein